jgi:hypothetical protein
MKDVSEYIEAYRECKSEDAAPDDCPLRNYNKTIIKLK